MRFYYSIADSISSFYYVVSEKCRFILIWNDLIIFIINDCFQQFTLKHEMDIYDTHNRFRLWMRGKWAICLALMNILGLYLYLVTKCFMKWSSSSWLIYIEINGQWFNKLLVTVILQKGIEYSWIFIVSLWYLLLLVVVVIVIFFK